MTVRSQDLPPPPPPARRADGKGSAVFHRRDLVYSRSIVERWTAWFVLAVGALGTVAALHGGWEPIRTLRPAWPAVGMGLLLQVILTWSQSAYYDRPLIAWPSRLIDAVLTAAGYGALFAPALAGLLASVGVPAAAAIPRLGQLPAQSAAAWAIVGIVCLWIAWYPDNRLVD